MTSTRSRTKSLSVMTKTAPSTSSLSIQTQDSSHQDSHESLNQKGKENIKVRQKSLKTRANNASKLKSRVAVKKKLKQDYCVCKLPDDGTPMVHCAECKNWYHFRCVQLSERDADDIRLYICPSCTEKTGRRSVMEWDGPEDMELVHDPRPHKPSKDIGQVSEDSVLDGGASDAESEFSSEDEYVDEDGKAKGKGTATTTGKRRGVRRLTISSDSSSGSDDGKRSAGRPRRVSASSRVLSGRKTSASPGPSSLKRKISTAQQQPPPKRKKSSDIGATDDPARKYCLGKLQEVFGEIFLKYPHVAGADGDVPTEKKSEDLTDEERGRVEEESKKFTTELEHCMFEIYSEPDKQGNPIAGGKYKERFRMLQFNLSKPDRATLHKRIASSHIAPKELSLMSSTDLANEEQKQSIKIAEQEALEHSILQKSIVPRAKITHKGLQDIEDVNGEVSVLREREKEREQEEEERRERERTARLKAAQQHQQQQQRATSAGAQGSSVPPESPVVPQSAGWGGPPSLPLQTGDDSARPPPNPLFGPTPSDFPTPMEPEMNLADLINLDEDPSPQDASPGRLESPTIMTSPTETVAAPPAASTSVPASPTGISPFAAKAADHEPVRKTSFDLSSFWAAPKTPAPASPPVTQEEAKDSFVDSDILGQEADDQDFDMFLEKDQEERNDAAPVDTNPEALQAAFNGQPQVWSGSINMPLDSTIPQETHVAARQMGGRTLGHDSLLWKTLFPHELLRIDGRVPIANSSKYLLQMRMNSAKELIAVAFLPESEASENGFKTLIDYLIGKDRHGLIFPWGSRPKEHSPGRELYIIPLRASDPLPDYVELLDELTLPKIRNSDYLLGIWILNKGKLAPPPSVPIPPPTAHEVARPAPLPIPSIVPASLAAEVASLTPEQIQMMLRTLSSTNVLSTAPYLNPPPPSMPAPPPPPPPAQAWPGPAPGYPPSYLPNASVNASRPPGPSYNSPPYERDQRPGSHFDRDGSHGDRGWRGNRGRNRGRGRGRDQDIPRKSLDSGWPRRNRSSSGGGPSSPQQSRWGEPPPPHWN